jgi:hypothetical protein
MSGEMGGETIYSWDNSMQGMHEISRLMPYREKASGIEEAADTEE